MPKLNFPLSSSNIWRIATMHSMDKNFQINCKYSNHMYFYRFVLRIWIHSRSCVHRIINRSKSSIIPPVMSLFQFKYPDKIPLNNITKYHLQIEIMVKHNISNSKETKLNSSQMLSTKCWSWCSHFWRIQFGPQG